MDQKRITQLEHTTFIYADAMYFEAAKRAISMVRKTESAVQRAETRMNQLKETEQRILKKYDNDELAAYDELERVCIDMVDYAWPELTNAYSPYIRECAMAHIAAMASLEAHINSKAKTTLSGSSLKSFDTLSLEGKWLFFPRICGSETFDTGAHPFQGFMKSIRIRNTLVHYKPKVVEWNAEALPLLERLGLTLAAAENSLESAQGMIRGLADICGEVPPDCISEQSFDYFGYEIIVHEHQDE